MRMTRKRFQFGAALVVVGVLLNGCSSCGDTSSDAPPPASNDPLTATNPTSQAQGTGANQRTIPLRATGHGWPSPLSPLDAGTQP